MEASVPQGPSALKFCSSDVVQVCSLGVSLVRSMQAMISINEFARYGP